MVFERFPTLGFYIVYGIRGGIVKKRGRRKVEEI
jgi:hypothetical protein